LSEEICYEWALHESKIQGKVMTMKEAAKLIAELMIGERKKNLYLYGSGMWMRTC